MEKHREPRPANRQRRAKVEYPDIPYPDTAPAALAHVRAYKVASDALCWVTVGPGYHADGRPTYRKRPAYVLPAAQLAAEGLESVGGVNMKFVRVFDDDAFSPWDGPRQVRQSDLTSFGATRSKTLWCPPKVESFKKAASESEFRHVMVLGAQEALRLAFEHDAAAGPSTSPDKVKAQPLFEADGFDGIDDDDDDSVELARLRLLDFTAAISRRRDAEPLTDLALARRFEAVVDLLLEPMFFTYRHARGVADAQPPLDVLAEALAEARLDETLDAELLARAEGVLKQMEDGTLVETMMQAERGT
mmetsp:Transcript_14748/g.50774  ORF Transcript_14748/g.50774 Transcript_14748/m.50774 type:complete len:304 (+) Transcript_14748:958-1869(+)